MKKEFVTPEIEVLKLKTEDVILTISNGDIDIDPWKFDNI